MPLTLATLVEWTKCERHIFSSRTFCLGSARGLFSIWSKSFAFMRKLCIHFQWTRTTAAASSFHLQPIQQKGLIIILKAQRFAPCCISNPVPPHQPASQQQQDMCARRAGLNIEQPCGLTLRTLLAVITGGSSLTAVTWMCTVCGALCFLRPVSLAVTVKQSADVSLLSWM